MESSPNYPQVPEITNTEPADQTDINAIALIHKSIDEHTLVEITEPDVTFETLSSQL
jgi:hypothetical protein